MQYITIKEAREYLESRQTTKATDSEINAYMNYMNRTD